MHCGSIGESKRTTEHASVTCCYLNIHSPKTQLSGLFEGLRNGKRLLCTGQNFDILLM
jgi:hypothetical protein